MSVKLRKRENKDGSISLVLDIYNAGKRSYEFLKQLQLPAGSSPVDRQVRKENLELAKKIAVSRAQELEASNYNVATDQGKKVIVLDWMKAYLKTYTKADKRVINSVINNFERFLEEKKQTGLLMKDFTENIVVQFCDRLKRNCVGEGAKSYYNRFRKLVKQAYRDKLLVKNPCEFVEPPKGEAAVKDVLTFEELQKIAETPTEAPEVKRAFIFCSLTGLRFVDAKALTWEVISLVERKMKVKQSKTGKVVNISLNSSALSILGKECPKKDRVFRLGSANGCNKSLSSLVRRAGITKHITWHCARHGFGTNLIYFGTDVHTASKLLGHSNLAQTNRYVRASSELAQRAVDGLPGINLSKTPNE